MRDHGVCVRKHIERRHAPRVGKTHSFGVLKLVCLSHSTYIECDWQTLNHTFYHGTLKACHASRPVVHASRPVVQGEAKDSGSSRVPTPFPPSSKLQ